MDLSKLMKFIVLSLNTVVIIAMVGSDYYHPSFRPEFDNQYFGTGTLNVSTVEYL